MNIIRAAILFIGLFGLAACKKNASDLQFTVEAINPYDFDLLIIGQPIGCDYGMDPESNPACILPANGKREYTVLGPGRPFLVNCYKAGTEYMVGWVNFVGTPGKHYAWTVEFDTTPLEQPR